MLGKDQRSSRPQIGAADRTTVQYPQELNEYTRN